jgi:hypothetical protein
LRNIAPRLRLNRLAGASAVAAIVATAAVAAPVAGAASAPILAPKIATSYTPTVIGITADTGITYTITDPNASGSLYQISFNNTLPSLAAVDNPAGVATSGCGTGVATANPGANTISASGITVKAGTPCTISVAVIGNTTGTASDAYTSFLYTSSSASYAVAGAAPAANATPASLTVLGAPTVTVSSPKNKAVFNYGQSVKVNYGCAVAAGDDPTQLTCSAIDVDTGASYNSGGKLDTKTPGKHELDFEAVSGNTEATTDVFVNYTVLPNNVFTITKTKAKKLTLSVPGAGKLSATATSGKTKVATGSAKPTKKGKVTLTVKLTKAGSALLTADKGTAKVKVSVSYTPKGGKKHTITKKVVI